MTNYQHTECWETGGTNGGGRRVTRDFTNQNATQFENTETEKDRRRERRHERGKNKVTDANATAEAEQCKSTPQNTFSFYSWCYTS